MTAPGTHPATPPSPGPRRERSLLTRALAWLRPSRRVVDAGAPGQSPSPEARWGALVQALPDAIAIVERDTTVRFVSDAAARVLGVEPHALLGHRLADLATLADAGAFDALLHAAAARPGTTPPFAWQVRRADGHAAHVESTALDLRGHPDVAGFLVATRDVSARHVVEQELEAQALRDDLTGLPNRVLFADRVERALARAWRTGARVTVLALDLEGMPTLTARLGEEQADRLRFAASRRIAQCLRSEDTAARLERDGFGLLLEALGDHGHVAAVCERLASVFREPFLLDTGEVTLAVSIGVAVASDTDHRDALLRNAEAARLAAHGSGAGSCEVFEPVAHAGVVRDLELRADLKHAFERDELTVAYQPVHDLSGGHVVGAEALLRWTHPTKGPIAPSAFVPLAERTGLIVPLGRRVLAEACRRAVAWSARAGADAPFEVTVNLGVRQLQDPGLVENVRTAVAQAGLEPRRLLLELPESALLGDREHLLVVLSALRSLGVRLSVDDFGTGYASLSCLRAFPVDVLKVSRVFVARLAGSGDGPGLARALVALGKTLRLRTVAEGIETVHQARELARLGCEQGQGYWFSPALPPEAFEGYLAAALAGPSESALRLTA